ncbi:MAG: FMN-binding negative transcriptional regulator [Terriglobales bacterium]
MYVPKHFREDSWNEIRKVIDQNSFATVVSCSAGVPVATHAPLRLVEPTPGKFALQGHFARANPHWRVLVNEQKALVIFAGPHSYVSPRWYRQLNVPTWNYVAVHVYGKPRLVSDPPELRELMTGLVNRYEGHVEAERRYTVEGLPPDYLESQMRGIVGFEISVDEVQASFKLSQNRTQEDHDNVIIELRKSDDQDAQRIAQAMSCPHARDGENKNG